MTTRQVWTCDRCGEDYEPDTDGSRDVRFVNSWRGSWRTLDLCWKCAVLLRTWIGESK